MERLTYWNKDLECWSYHGPSGDAAKRLAAYEGTGLEPEEVNRVLNAYGRGMTLRTNAGERLEIIKDIQTERLKELAQAEKDGRLVVLPPIKIGDTAFFIINKSIYEGKVYYMRWEHHKGFGVRGDISADSLGGCVGARLCDFGKTVFLTREEAEEALKKREDDNETD